MRLLKKLQISIIILTPGGTGTTWVEVLRVISFVSGGQWGVPPAQQWCAAHTRLWRHPPVPVRSFLPWASGAGSCHKCHLTQTSELTQNCFTLTKLIHKDVRVERNAVIKERHFELGAEWLLQLSLGVCWSYAVGPCFKMFLGHWLWMNNLQICPESGAFPETGAPSCGLCKVQV